MFQTETLHGQQGRALAQARRKAMSGGGKAAINRQPISSYVLVSGEMSAPITVLHRRNTLTEGERCILNHPCGV
jgi:hypothetical protein